MNVKTDIFIDGKENIRHLRFYARGRPTQSQITADAQISLDWFKHSGLPALLLHSSNRGLWGREKQNVGAGLRKMKEIANTWRQG